MTTDAAEESNTEDPRTQVPGTEDTGIWRGRLGLVSVGIFSLAFLFAFESFAVITALPAVVADLNGLSWYAIAFAAPIATSIVSTVAGGAWSDRLGPGRPMGAGVVAFAGGLVAAGTATSMPAFLAGRALQGVGSGLAAVALYVLVARAYPASLRQRAFVVLTSAWTLPALVGPPVAGTITETIGWRWVFVGVVPLTALALALLWRPAARVSPATHVSGAPGGASIGWAALASGGVAVVAVAGQREVAIWPVLLVAGVCTVLLAGPRFLPPGTWTGRVGLPSVIATRGLMSAAYFGAEAYLVLALVEFRGVSSTVAGLVVGITAFTWFGGAWASAHVPALADPVRRLAVATGSIAVATAAVMATVWPLVPFTLVVVAWSAGGFGMGMGTSTSSVLVLDLSRDEEQGRHSAAAQVNTHVLQSVWLALGSALFAGMLSVSVAAAILTVGAGSLVLALLTFLPVSRVRAGKGRSGSASRDQAGVT